MDKYDVLVSFNIDDFLKKMWKNYKNRLVGGEGDTVIC